MKPLSKWWDGYNDNKIVLIDDLEIDSMKYLSHYLKLWGDPFGNLSGEIKGATINLNYECLYITSNYTILECIQNMAKDTKDGNGNVDMVLYEAIKRRFIEL